MTVDWSTYWVFRRLSLDDEPSAFDMYMASDAAGELAYSREELPVALVSMVRSIILMGRSNGNDIGG